MKSGLCVAYCTLLFVSLVSSGVLFLIVASEATHRTHKNNIINIMTSEGIKESNSQEEDANSETEDRGNEGPLINTIYEKPMDEEPVASVDEQSNESEPPQTIDLDKLGFVSSISKNSGVTADGISDIPTAASLITLGDKSSGLHIETKLEEVLDDNLTNQTQLNATFNAPNVVDIVNEAEDLMRGFNADGSLNVETESTNSVETETIESHLTGDAIAEDTNRQPVVEERVPADSSQIKPSEVNLTEENNIPVFSEWAQKQMEEAEKQLERDVVNSSAMKKNATAGSKPTVLKLRAKNYASPDCGAKIIAYNAEAQSVASVLSASRDEYLLSPCTSRIWFVVELCEAIQADKIDLANFELFSSGPKNFSVGVSNRFPTRDWITVGQFIASDVRDLQSFDLLPHLAPHVFGKFVRVDIFSHYNSEHFCPVSMFRVFGTSEFEAFETDNRPAMSSDDSDEFDDELEQKPLEQQNNLFKSASDAVLSIVKKAAEVLVKTNDSQRADRVAQVGFLPGDCVTPSHAISCDRCTADERTHVSQLVTCKQKLLASLLNVPLIRDQVMRSQICTKVAGVVLDCSKVEEDIHQHRNYVEHMFPVTYFIAMCNVLANAPNKSGDPLNSTSAGSPSNLTVDQKGDNNLIDNLDKRKMIIDVAPSVDGGSVHDSTQTTESKEESTENEYEFESVEVQNELGSAELNLDTKYGEEILTLEINVGEDNIPTQIQSPPASSIEETSEEVIEAKLPNDDTNIFNTISSEVELDVAEISDSSQEVVSDQIEQPKEQPPSIVEQPSGLTDPEIKSPDVWENLDMAEIPVIEEMQKPNNQPHGESVFLRLSNRVKALERNMSLSGQYLEELSRRYKKQVEELQQSFAKTLVSIEEQSKRKLEREAQLYEQNQLLRQDLNQLIEVITFWKSFCICLGLFVITQIIILCSMRSWFRSTTNSLTSSDSNGFIGGPSTAISGYSANRIRYSRREFNRRKSVECVSGHVSPVTRKKRRPSEEALNIVGSYKELLINDDSMSSTVSPDCEEYDQFGNAGKKRKSKSRKSSQIKRANSMEPAMINGAMQRMSSRHHGMVRQDSAPGKFLPDDELSQLYILKNRLGNQPPLNEDYENYMPVTDLAYNEFMPDGPSGAESSAKLMINGGEGATDENTPVKPKGKMRRLSSPAFLKFSRGSKRVTQDAATGWEWYRRLSAGPNQAGKKKDENGGNGVIAPTNGLVSDSNDSDSNRTVETTNNTLNTIGSNSGSVKKQGSFRRILKKVF